MHDHDLNSEAKHYVRLVMAVAPVLLPYPAHTPVDVGLRWGVKCVCPPPLLCITGSAGRRKRSSLFMLNACICQLYYSCLLHNYS